MEIIDKIKKLRHEYGLGVKEFLDILKRIIQTSEPYEDRNQEKPRRILIYADKDLPKEIQEQYLEFHKSLVSQSINFLVEHPDIIGLAKELREKREEQLGYTPFLDLSLYLSDIEESVQEKEWVPSLDSTLEINIGGQPILISM